jgi:hypothetical protein
MTRKINNSYTLGQSNAPTTGGDMLKTRADGTLVWEGVDDKGYLSPRWYGDRGVICGGAASEKDRMQYISISTRGNAVDFGNLVSGRENTGALSNGTRGVIGGGEYNLTMEYITISTLGNTTDFGDLTGDFATPHYNVEGCCNGTRGLFVASRYATADGPIAYITVATTGNATDFGDVSVDRYSPGALADATRAVFGGGQFATGPVVMSNVMDYVTIDTTADAVDFGNLTLAGNQSSGLSDTTRGLFTARAASPYHTIDYITIQTTGNATDFGDRTTSQPYGCAAMSDNNYGIMAGGSQTSYQNVIDYVVVQTTGNAVDFGNLLAAEGYCPGLAGY